MDREDEHLDRVGQGAADAARPAPRCENRAEPTGRPPRREHGAGDERPAEGERGDADEHGRTPAPTSVRTQAPWSAGGGLIRDELAHPYVRPRRQCAAHGDADGQHRSDNERDRPRGHGRRPIVCRIHSQPVALRASPAVTQVAPIGSTTTARTSGSVVTSRPSMPTGITVRTCADSPRLRAVRQPLRVVDRAEAQCGRRSMEGRCRRSAEPGRDGDHGAGRGEVPVAAKRRIAALDVRHGVGHRAPSFDREADRRGRVAHRLVAGHGLGERLAQRVPDLHAPRDVVAPTRDLGGTDLRTGSEPGDVARDPSRRNRRSDGSVAAAGTTARAARSSAGTRADGRARSRRPTSRASSSWCQRTRRLVGAATMSSRRWAADVARGRTVGRPAASDAGATTTSLISRDRAPPR